MRLVSRAEAARFLSEARPRDSASAANLSRVRAALVARFGDRDASPGATEALYEALPRVMRALELGEGGRFAALEFELAARGARDPAALAAWIGRQRYGARRMARMSAAGRARRGPRR